MNRLYVGLRAVLVISLLSTAAYAQGTSVIVGTVTDAQSGAPVADALVTVRSPSLAGEQIVTTDATGLYRIPQLPGGRYTLRVEGERFKPFTQADIELRLDRTVRVNVNLIPDTLTAEEIVVVGKAPVIDVGSASTGVNIGQEIVKNFAIVRPGSGSSGSRTFESLAEVAPQTQGDTYGVSISGTSSPENSILLDGVSVNDPAFGTIGTPLSIEFVGDTSVVTGGYLPEFGRAAGGVFSAVTKSGGNEFHGSVFFNISPFTADPTEAKSQQQSISRRRRPVTNGDFGFELGGPIVKDKLWFFAGFNPSWAKYKITRSVNELLFQRDASGNYVKDAESGELIPVNDDDGFQKTNTLSSRDFYGSNRSFQYIGKLTYNINQDHTIALTAIGTPSRSGDRIDYNVVDNSGPVTPVGNLALRRSGAIVQQDASDLAFKYTGAFNNKKTLLDVTLGWHSQTQSELPRDGSKPGDTVGLASEPAISVYPGRFGLGDFSAVEDVPAGCFNTDGSVNADACPAGAYAFGGFGLMSIRKLNRLQGKATLTYLLEAAGHHIIKAGFDYERNFYEANSTYSGGISWTQRPDGRWVTSRTYGYLQGPNDVVPLASQVSSVYSYILGGFVQDSWAILDKVTLNAGVRYDTQLMYGSDGKLGLAIPNMISPRIGLVWDPTQTGGAKLFANWGRYYQAVTLRIAERSYPAERQTVQRQKEACFDPTSDDASAINEQCLTDDNNSPYASSVARLWPSTYINSTGGSSVAIDPDLEAQNSDEWVGGGEIAMATLLGNGTIFDNSRFGLTYTKRYINRVIEDMSTNEAATYFLGNPGYGIAKSFPKAERNYDALTALFTKAMSDGWMAQMSYTWSKTTGNYGGLFKSDTGQLDPFITADFDLVSLLPNRKGALNGDTRHTVKAYISKEFVISDDFALNLGLTYRTRSGNPLTALAAHPVYGADESFVTERGTLGRLPWTHSVDAMLQGNVKVSQQTKLGFSVEAYNALDLRQITARDESYANAPILPAEGKKGDPTKLAQAGELRYIDEATGETKVVNPDDKALFNQNFLRPTAYQQPISLRFGIRLSF